MGLRSRYSQNNGLFWLLGDHLGSTAVTADNDGNKYGEVRYKAWGETRYTSGNTLTTYRFTGQREEQSLGLYFYNARWYDPALGRWLQPDTIIPEEIQGAQAWDIYAYVSNNPVNFVDPTGYFECIDEEYKLALHPTSERIIEFRGNVSDKDRYKIIWGTNLDNELDSTVLEIAL